MRAYSVDLRKRIVEAVKTRGMSKPAVAELYGVSRATVYRYLELDKHDDLVPKPHPGQARRLDVKGCKLLLEQVKDHADLTLEEHAEKLAEHGISLQKSSIGNYFVRLGVRRKKDALPPRT